ncbi:MAG: sulfite exporter TauE/SafE family protein [Candidatus Omnitrophica bacterium]|nr:sulfite exporter TauE/SafE family protein [Candidatus Omnitrophota bacterium]
MIEIICSLFLVGLSFGSGACIASCGPLLITYMVGTEKNIAKCITLYILFSAARIAVYVILSLCVFLVGRFVIMRFVADISRYLIVAGGVLILVIGVLVAMGKEKRFEFCGVLHKRLLEHDAKSVLMMGLVIGLLPCAPLIALFSYVGLVSKTWVQSLIYSLSFGLGTAVSPLILLVIFAGAMPKFLGASGQAVIRIVRYICATIIIILGLQLIWRGFVNA